MQEPLTFWIISLITPLSLRRYTVRKEPMGKPTDKEDRVRTDESAQNGTRRVVHDGQHIIDQDGKISPSSKRILEEVKIRRAEALRLLANH